MLIVLIGSLVLFWYIPKILYELFRAARLTIEQAKPKRQQVRSALIEIQSKPPNPYQLERLELLKEELGEIKPETKETVNPGTWTRMAIESGYDLQALSEIYTPPELVKMGFQEQGETVTEIVPLTDKQRRRKATLLNQIDTIQRKLNG